MIYELVQRIFFYLLCNYDTQVEVKLGYMLKLLVPSEFIKYLL